MKKFLIPMLALGVLAGSAGIAVAVDNQTIAVELDKSSSKRKANTITITTAASNNDGSKISPAVSAVVKMAKGVKFNASPFKTCKTSTLTNSGPSACKSAKVGEGTAKVDAGAFGRNLDAVITAFNGPKKGGKATVLLHSAVTTPPFNSVTAVLEGVLTNKSSGATLDVTIPPLPTLPGAPNASISEFSVEVGKVVKKIKKKKVRRNGRRVTKKVAVYHQFVSFPRKCKNLPFSSTFTYEDASSKVAQTTASCS